MLLFNKEPIKAKPFLKWAGGKSQLIPSIHSSLPEDIKRKDNLTYIEPFIGSGAVMFWFLRTFNNVKKAIINDINPDLSKAYITVKLNPAELINSLSSLQEYYYNLKSEEDRKTFFMEKREEFNTRSLSDLSNTSLLIFLNRTCFNGLYRVNSKNKFNVPFGKYGKPKICDPETIIANSKLLQKVIILNGDYSDTLEYATKDTFFYFDPPYKPLSKTASFNSYSSKTFDDEQQEQLNEFCKKLDESGYYWLLSNSDLKNTDKENNYFDELYKDFYIERVKAKRNINSVSGKRGKINELLISNYNLHPLVEAV